jgi:hypothetical protein
VIDDALPSDIDADLLGLRWYRVAVIATARRKELEATRRELDRANAEIVRLRTDLIDLQQLMRSK